MTMQDGPSGFGGIGDITWDDLRPDLVARFRRRHSLPAAQNRASPQDQDEPDSPALGRALLESLGLTHLTQTGTGPRTGETVPTAEALLLFGTEEAIGRHFPFLKTRVSLRDLARNREKMVDLPGNIPECLEALGRFVAAELPARAGSWEKPDAAGDTRVGAEEADHASPRDAAILPWLYEMAVTRDYTQTRVARLVRDRDHVFLEYPRSVVFEEEPGTSPVIRYLRNAPIQAVLRRLYPTMQGDLGETAGEAEEAANAARAREQAYFGLVPLRIEGRFFKIMAALPDQDLHGSEKKHSAVQAIPEQTETRPVASKSGQLAENNKRGNMTMQVLWATVATRVTSWFRPRPAPRDTPPHVVPEPARRAKAPSTFETSAPASAATRPAPHPGSSRHPPNILPPVLDPYPAPRNASADGMRSSPQTSPASRAERADASERVARILAFCSTPRHRDEIQKHVGMNNRDHFRKEVLNRLIAQGLIAPTLPNKPNSPKQQYVTRPKVTAATTV